MGERRDNVPGRNRGDSAGTPEGYGEKGLRARACVPRQDGRGGGEAGGREEPWRREEPALYHQAGHAGQLSLRPVCGAEKRAAADSRLQRNHGQTHGGGLHQHGPGGLEGVRGQAGGGRRGHGGRRGADLLRLRHVHRRPGPAQRPGEGGSGHRALVHG